MVDLVEKDKSVLHLRTGEAEKVNFDNEQFSLSRSHLKITIWFVAVVSLLAPLVELTQARQGKRPRSD